MRPLALLLLVLLVSSSGGCFGGFEQPPQTAKQKQKPTKQAPASRPATDDQAANKKEEQQKQSYAEAWQVICSAEKQVGSETQDRTERGVLVANWIVENLKNKKARYWFIGFGKVKKDRRAVFMKEATKGGQPDCPLADFLFADEPSASKPTRSK